MKTLNCDVKEIVGFFRDQGEFSQITGIHMPAGWKMPKLLQGRINKDLVEIGFDLQDGDGRTEGMPLFLIFKSVGTDMVVVSPKIKYKKEFWFYTFIVVILIVVCLSRMELNDHAQMWTWILIGLILFFLLAFRVMKKERAALFESVYQILDARFNKGITAESLRNAARAEALITGNRIQGKQSPPDV